MLPINRRGVPCTRRPRPSVALAAALFMGLALATAGVASPAQAAKGPSSDASRDSMIAWTRAVDADFSAARIVIADGEGRGVRELTHAPVGVTDIDPSISPDGRWVAFERDSSDGSSAIGLVGTNGRDEHILDLGCTEPCAADLSPTWTPDGRHLVFTRVVGPFDRPNDSAASAVLWKTDLNGRHITRFSQTGIDGAFEDYRATFAPGGYVAFVRVRNADGHNAVFRMSPDATDLRQLTPWELDADLPAVSPASSGPSKDLVVFETFGHGPPDGFAQAIATVPATCRSDQDCAARIRLLTSDGSAPVQNFNPDWSPDGRGIAFVRFETFPDAPPAGDIVTMRWNGEKQRAVSTTPLFEFRPNWGVAPTDRRQPD
jgi:Tol biopolymer transport system component